MKILKSLWGWFKAVVWATVLAWGPLIIYYWLIASGSPIYSRGRDVGNWLIHYAATTFPTSWQWYGIQMGGAFENWLRERDADKAILYTTITWGMLLSFFLARRLLHHCRRLLRQSYYGNTEARTESTDAPPQESSQTNQGVTSMRNFFGSIIGVLAGITTILVTFMMAATYLAMPTVAVANPTYQWVLQFLISNGTLVVVAYAALNVWSASVDHGSTWANSLDKALSVIALVVLTMIAVLVIGQAIIQTPTAEKLAEMYNAYPLLLAAWLFSIFDVFVAQNRTRGVSVHAEASGTGAATGEVVNIVRERVIRTVETRYEQPTYAPATGDRPPRTAEPTAPTAVAS